MRKTDQIANEKFNGNIEETICYIMFEKSKSEIDELCEEWTNDELNIAQNLIMEACILKYGEDKFKRMLKTDEEIELTDEDIDRAKEYYYSQKKEASVVDNSRFTLSSEEISNAELNPYKANLLKDIFKLIIVNGSVIGLGAMLQNYNLGVDFKQIAGFVTSIYTTMKALDIGPNIIEYFKFKNQKVDDNKLENGGGKKL